MRVRHPAHFSQEDFISLKSVQTQYDVRHLPAEVIFVTRLSSMQFIVRTSKLINFLYLVRVLLLQGAFSLHPKVEQLPKMMTSLMMLKRLSRQSKIVMPTKRNKKKKMMRFLLPGAKEQLSTI
jgi:hypothetical protein